ncbi:MAG: C25 family cysteine peptidase [Leadbetterella sp.]|nr:C25 family cysteine peptidase [Leadbetterella sp.]
MDIAVGRVPARTVPELNNYIAKYIRYRQTGESSDWNNRLVFVADNRDYNLHQRDAEELDALALETFPGFINDKLYLDDFPVTDGTAPEANQRLHELVNNGTYLITYIGHGAEDGLTGEKLLTLADIMAFRNAGRLPVWFTATCQFGKFDNPGVVSGAELMLLRSQGGAIALLTTTRPVYSSTNQRVNQAFFKNITGTKTLGELFRLTKNQSVRGEINRNFSLLGDPSLPLPRWNGSASFSLEADTLTAHRKVRFSGRTENVQNGSVLVSVIDKPGTKNTLGGFPDSPAFEYLLRSEVIFSGRFPVRNYTYEGEIVLPNDQFPGTGEGRIVIHSLTADSSLQEFSGLASVLISTGELPETYDRRPPDLTATLSPDRYLTWTIRDEDGINVSLNNAGSRLALEINGRPVADPLRYFRPLTGATEGEIRFYVGNLGNGRYQSSLIASDIYNNTASKTFEFQIERPELKMLELTAYPNPVTDYLRLKVKHNRPGDDLDATLMVSDALGRELYREEFSCTRCEEEILLETDFYGSSPAFPKVFYRLIVRSENHSAQAGGTLFFWK